MAFFTGGVTFSPGEQVTAARLNTLITGATPINFNRTAFASDSKIITTGTSPPTSPTAGELFFDASATQLLLYLDSSTTVGLGPAQEVSLTAQSTLASGDVVLVDTGNEASVETSATAGSVLVAGVAKQAITSAPSTCRVQSVGKATVNCDNTAVSIGNYLISSGTTAGQATAVSTIQDGVFGIALSSKGTGTGTVTALLFPVVKSVDSATVINAEATYLGFTNSSTAVTSGQWYDVPGATAVAISTDGTDAMDVDFTTTQDNQIVTFELDNFELRVGTNAATLPTGFRVLLDGVAVVTFVDNATTAATVSTSGDFDIFGPVKNCMVSTNPLTIVDHLVTTMQVASAGAHTIRLQYRAGATGAMTTTSLGAKTATLAVRSTTAG